MLHRTKKENDLNHDKWIGVGGKFEDSESPEDCALRETRLKIALVESHPPRPAEGWDARVYAVSPANAEFLKQIGAWRHLDADRLNPVHAMKVFGDSGAHLDFSALRAGDDGFGFPQALGLNAGKLLDELFANSGVHGWRPMNEG